MMSRPKRELSQQVQVCINKLYKQQNSKWIRLIRRSGEIAAIPYLTPFLESPELELQTAAENTISDLLKHCPPSDLVWLSEKMREYLPYGFTENASQWVHLTAENIKKWPATVHPVKIIMASFHWNGYVREEALKRIIQFHDGSEIPFLLIRMNDWVSPIRFHTYKALKQRIHTHNAGAFIRNITLVKRLESCGRDRYEALTESIYDLLRQSECLSELEQGTISTDRDIRRFCLQMALESRAAVPVEVLEKALYDRDASIRLWAARKTGNVLSGSDLQKILLLMVQDSFPSVRREALELMAHHFPEQAIPFLREGLLDRNAVIREIARRHLALSESISYAEFYMDKIWSDNEKHLAAALYGLGETGQRADAEIIAEYMHYPAIHVRKAVVHSLARLDADTYQELLWQSLLDSQPGISREAVQAFQRHAYLLEKDELVHGIVNSDCVHVQRNMLRLLPAFGGWQHLESLLDIMAGTRTSWIQQASIHQLNNWTHVSGRSYRSRLTSEQEQVMLNKLESCAIILESKQVHMLRWLITS
ncbi:HEAT repeat domain-containing protein [Paenibacillus shenyangensis]|uniref:HEAT repeat domain-containing protein n=1 Tax=Paenibacillus sp. A9 TaxID=1284352 RepID=UPI000A80787A|nr:HEAT repeat domain-containing protein [Paenibacillus sp. A9]